ncbi:uncharacterized protein BDR25DRAFT_300349 [Lindgomyces ingoldianus]|uniref:Uncharacterized protein n=1 Tax=Lindgomyces ingoldianus TaxID=673940 RepID=A0ACB6RBX0_9PLEO|nr:uncharacterized protein BDR25DRAFT_300349 [Lindgomyces ingoldianus]KAF2476258.1 hypothetical protein BDR25DRAFT_300349 [Lindgomyces ingoldianus]
MFHQGTLQSGISLAISEQKLVACFVRDDNSESATWENEWLQSGWISNLLVQKAVMLRLEAGSTEAGFLSAFCPISNIPTFVVIQNGQLCDQITSGVSKDEFINRIRTVLGADAIPGTAPTSTSTSAEITTSDTTENQAADGTSVRAPVPVPASVPVPAPAPTEYHPVSTILPPSSKAKGKRKAIPPDPESDPASSNAAKQAARDALRKKKQDEKDELARIQSRIEADRAERKAQDAARKADRERLTHSSSPTSAQFPTSTSKKGSQARDVHLNVRLFDGHTVRSTFPRTAKLQDDVRLWVDQEFTTRAENPRQSHPPYIFKQILAPLPSRELSASDESETLGDIDLAPSATLVLIPVQGYTEAYSSIPGGGIVGGVVGGVTGLVGSAFGLASSTVGYIGSTLGAIVGYGRGSMEEERPLPGRTLGESQPETADPSTVRVRTLADQRAREPRSQEFYNGNQLNFEPNEDDSTRT